MSSSPPRPAGHGRTVDPLDGGAPEQPTLGAGPETPIPTPTRPQGVYAMVDITEVINDGGLPYNPTGAGETVFKGLYDQLLANPAIAGLTIKVHYDWAQPQDPDAGVANPNNWAYIDDAFDETAAYNNANDAGPFKNVQLFIETGFDAPTWLWDGGAGGTLNPTPIAFCDPMFENDAAPAGCGMVTFQDYSEHIDGVPSGGNAPLPLPWNAAYIQYFKNYLTALATRYAPGSTVGAGMLVSVAISGPTAASAEMQMPSYQHSAHSQTQFVAGGGAAISPDDMWNDLIVLEFGSGSANSNQPFIDAWKNQINFFQSTFKGTTLILVPDNGDGLPTYGALPGFGWVESRV